MGIELEDEFAKLNLSSKQRSERTNESTEWREWRYKSHHPKEVINGVPFQGVRTRCLLREEYYNLALLLYIDEALRR